MMKTGLNISWGKRIAILYLGFAALIITLVVSSFGHKVDLVSGDYYAQELNYQQRINAISNLKDKGATSFQLNEKTLTITLPEFFQNKTLDGTIHFYRPSDSALDKTVKLGSGIKQEFSTAELKKGIYLVKLEFSCEGVNYFREEGIYIL